MAARPFNDAETLQALAAERARLMERIQAIDDEASTLVETERRRLSAAIRSATDAEDRLETAWGHVRPKSLSPL